MNGKKREKGQWNDGSAVVTIHPQHPTMHVTKGNNGNATSNARGQDQPPLLPLATEREDSASIKEGTPLLLPLLLLLLLQDIETSLHLHHRIIIEHHLPLHLSSHEDNENLVLARKDDIDMTLHHLLPLPLLLQLQEGEDMKLLMKARDPTLLNRSPLPPLKKKKRRRRMLTHLSLVGRGKQSPAVPLLRPPPLLNVLQGTGKERFLILVLPLYMHLPLPHPQLEVEEIGRGMRKGNRDLVPQVMSHQDKGQGPDLGPIPDPETARGGGGERVEIVTKGEIIAIVAVRVILQGIDKGATAEIDHQKKMEGERGEGLGERETGKQESAALLVSLIKDVIETEREEREEGMMGTGGEGSIVLLPSLTRSMTEIVIGRREDLVGIEKEGSAVLLRNLMEDGVIDTVKEGGGEEAPLYAHHQTGTGGGAGEGGGGADLAADDDVM